MVFSGHSHSGAQGVESAGLVRRSSSPHKGNEGITKIERFTDGHAPATEKPPSPRIRQNLAAGMRFGHPEKTSASPKPAIAHA